MEIEVRHPSGAIKRVQLADGSHGGPIRSDFEGRRCVMAFWSSMTAVCYIDLDSGAVLAESAPLVGGFYDVDLETGRLVGSRWSVPMAVLDGLCDLGIGTMVPVEHDRSGEKEKVQLIDIESSRGVARVMAKDGVRRGSCAPTGWCATAEALQVLRGSRRVA